ncbi:chromodomain-helicase-DNA-binding protein 1-like [Pyrus ussuriensis x Pyrus communis]|uniref:Chromodomain-helicase-DNA-binding protein 1-like n=1 Tax=Pyrus ussuriensis x Pyrus communis TaxID=2448454 RepID=A0A5N5G3G1_9ROSA|nr:chromodomain-helicase-DNA-binding protein 1-like [Pyrus ussuriensis x Pyrus communis]
MSKLWIMNLGGSESLAKTEVQGGSLKEAQIIYKSPSVLRDVISALSRIKALNRLGHVDEENAKPSHNVVRNDVMDQESKGTNRVKPHDLRHIIFKLPLLDLEEVNNGVLELFKLNAMAEKVISVWNKQVAIDGEMKFECNPADVLDGHDFVVGESSSSLSFSSGFDESSSLSYDEKFEEVSQENYREATENKNSLAQFKRASIPGRIIMISKPSSTILFLSLEDKANFQGGSIVMNPNY